MFMERLLLVEMGMSGGGNPIHINVARNEVVALDGPIAWPILPIDRVHLWFS